jgi:hypothetical protein
MTAAKDTRRELLAALDQLGRLRPEWRMGQTLANVAMAAGRLDASGVWDLEDVEALAAVRELIEQQSEVVAEAFDHQAAPGAAGDRGNGIGLPGR